MYLVTGSRDQRLFHAAGAGRRPKWRTELAVITEDLVRQPMDTDTLLMQLYAISCKNLRVRSLLPRMTRIANKTASKLGNPRREVFVF